jgi:ABC-type antimicrobial peptide transport system permease subunit
VQQRRREIAVRVAIGASAGTVFREIAVRGLSLAAFGIVIGAVIARASSGAIQNLLFGVTAGDPWTYAVIAGVLILTAALAVTLPARRASRVDPIQALRAE